MKKLMITMVLVYLSSNASAKSNKIASIPEASGICYASTSDTLFVVHDEGRIYEITLQGKILRKVVVGKYDFEGIACDNKNSLLYVAVEKDEAIFTLSMQTLKIIKKSYINRTYNGKMLLKKDKKRGFEGITFDKDFFYVANQSKKPYPKKDSSVIVKVKRNLKNRMKIIDVIDPKHPDISGLTIYHKKLYMLSDTKDRIYIYHLKKEKLKKKSYKLPKFAQEGIAFDEKGNIYIADDEGAIFKYKVKDIFR